MKFVCNACEAHGENFGSAPRCYCGSVDITPVDKHPPLPEKPPPRDPAAACPKCGHREEDGRRKKCPKCKARMWRRRRRAA